MSENVTLLRPGAPAPDTGAGGGSTLPAHLLDAVRHRVRVLTSLMIVAFSFDPLVHAGLWLLAPLFHRTIPPHFYDQVGFDLVNVGAVLFSLALMAVARRPDVPAGRLLTLGLVYEVVVCFVVSVLTFWQFYLEKHVLPEVTWVVGVIIIFPLVMPGPPKRILLAALASAATAPLALWLLMALGRIPTGDEVFGVFIPPLFAAGFAYFGARVVYGLGREVAEARELGSYRLEERLGQGGMGEVWRARHRFLARPAAIKLIRPILATDDAPGAALELQRRFEREAQAIAALRSPHTITLFDYGVSADGAFYYVMELLDGLDTDALVTRHGPQPPERVIHILRQACHSLSEAHARGLVHRDIKPANIFLCHYGEDHDFVKVLDFGLVKTLDEPRAPHADLTADNTLPGTPAFMSPEQALGHATLDCRSDLYSLGCVAYWLLTGETVFRAPNAMGHLVAHASTPPEAPSRRTSQAIPAALEALVMACLEKDPARRPQTARELIERLERVEAAAWDAERARAWWARPAGGSADAPRLA